MSNHVNAPSVVEQVESYPVEVRAVDGGWEILCPPGPLAQFLLAASGSSYRCDDHRVKGPGPIADFLLGEDPTRIEWRGDQPYLIIRFSAELDREILRMIQLLIDLRYRTGRVQLELWGDL
jgi:hypothetical protein